MIYVSIFLLIAAGVLGMLGNDEALTTLLDGRLSDDPLVQKNAAPGPGYPAAPEAASRLHEILDDPRGRWKSYAKIAIAGRDLPRRSPAGKVSYLDPVASGNDYIAAPWALGTLGDLRTPAAADVLRRIGARGGKFAPPARRQPGIVERP